MNNATSTATGKSPNEVIYGFRLREALDLATIDQQPFPNPEALTAIRASIQTDVRDAIAFATMAMKDVYDRHHQQKFFRVGDMVNLRLHRGYTLPAVRNKKL